MPTASYYQDEARFGQHGTLTRVWAKVGSRPPAIRQTQHDYLYVFSAVCPEIRINPVCFPPSIYGEEATIPSRT